MSDLVSPTIVLVGHLKGIQFHSELGCQRIQEGLGFLVGIETSALQTTTRLFACSVVAVLIVDIDTIKVLVANDIGQVS